MLGDSVAVRWVVWAPLEQLFVCDLAGFRFAKTALDLTEQLLKTGKRRAEANPAMVVPGEGDVFGWVEKVREKKGRGLCAAGTNFIPPELAKTPSRTPSLSCRLCHSIASSNFGSRLISTA